MKIRNDQLRALQETEVQRAKTQKTGEDFTEFLTRELHTDKTGSQPLGNAGALPLNIQNPALLDLQSTLATEDMESAELLNQAMRSMEGMLSGLEDYAGQLALDDKADLRQAYAMLEGLSGQINNFKARFPGMDKQQPGLAALLNELDVLTTTETFKFNRGDYI